MTKWMCPPRHKNVMVEWLMDEGRTVGCRVLQVGSLYIEIHRRLYNLRVVVTDALSPLPDLDNHFDQVGYAWCYPSELGYPAVASCVWEWHFNAAHPGRTNPPGPWIKAVHTGFYRKPGIGQPGPDGKVAGFERKEASR